MTRRVWNTEDGWTVACGWDRPLQHYFMDISKECPVCNGDGLMLNGMDCDVCRGEGDVYAFNNLESEKYRARRGGMQLSDVAVELSVRLTEWPHQLFELLVADGKSNRGNDILELGMVGKLRVRASERV